jgi:hypothetical protein
MMQARHQPVRGLAVRDQSFKPTYPIAQNFAQGLRFPRMSVPDSHLEKNESIFLTAFSGYFTIQSNN